MRFIRTFICVALQGLLFRILGDKLLLVAAIELLFKRGFWGYFKRRDSAVRTFIIQNKNVLLTEQLFAADAFYWAFQEV